MFLATKRVDNSIVRRTSVLCVRANLMFKCFWFQELTVHTRTLQMLFEAEQHSLRCAPVNALQTARDVTKGETMPASRAFAEQEPNLQDSLDDLNCLLCGFARIGVYAWIVLSDTRLGWKGS